MKKSDYELIQLTSDTSVKQEKKQQEKVNVLPGDAEEILSEEEQEDMGSYESTQELDFEVDEIKDCLEKKKKRRNYLEFRPDYEED
jgi:hypothetical protein